MSPLPRLEWPVLDYARDRPTFELLRLWTQIVGKVRTAQTPWLNHSWQVPLYVTARGLGTSLIPYDEQSFDLEFDFIDHEMRLRTSRGREASMPLEAAPVSAFWAAVVALLDREVCRSRSTSGRMRSRTPRRSCGTIVRAIMIRTRRSACGGPY